MLLHNKKIIYGVVGYCAIRSKSVYLNIYNVIYNVLQYKIDDEVTLMRSKKTAQRRL